MLDVLAMNPSSCIFIDNLSTVDFCYFSEDAGILGESFWLDVEITGNVGEDGFVLDFAAAKKTIKNVVDRELDHKLAIPQSISKQDSAYVFATPFGQITYQCPEQAIVALPFAQIGKPEFIQFLEEKINSEIDAAVKVYLREDQRFQQEACFRYTHGLRFHQGNCVRLFHGHRNPIVVEENKNRIDVIESFLANYFNRKHIVNQATIQSRSVSHLEVQYECDQGVFQASIPRQMVIELDGEPSIEYIAQHAQAIAEEKFPQRNFTVRAYEGLNKGAFAK